MVQAVERSMLPASCARRRSIRPGTTQMTRAFPRRSRDVSARRIWDVQTIKAPNTRNRPMVCSIAVIRKPMGSEQSLLVQSQRLRDANLIRRQERALDRRCAGRTLYCGKLTMDDNSAIRRATSPPSVVNFYQRLVISCLLLDGKRSAVPTLS